MFNFENLDVYRKSTDLSIKLSMLASKFPICYSRLQNQLIGAVISIALNIAEGSGRINSKEKAQFYRIAQASAFELIAIMDICDGLGLLKRNDWDAEIESICKMLSAMIRNLVPKP